MAKRSGARRSCGGTLLILLVMITVGISGCNWFGSSSSEIARVPARSGQLWEVDRSAARSAMPGAMLAYANGLHVIVLDGKEVYAGMTALKAESTSAGGLAIKLASGLEAQLVPVGEGIELRFSTGESVAMRKKEVK